MKTVLLVENMIYIGAYYTMFQTISLKEKQEMYLKANIGKKSLEGSQEDFNKSIEVILVAVLIGVEEIVLIISKQITEGNKVSK